MLGQACNGRPCGSFGEISIFSFYPNKHVTTGEGGMIVTDDHALAERCRGLRNLCFQPSKRFVHEELGWNFRMTNLQAALGLAQLERLDEFVVRKRRMGTIYNELLADFATIEKPLPRTDYAENIYWVYGVVLKEDIFCNAAEIITHLGNEGIGTRPFFTQCINSLFFKKWVCLTRNVILWRNVWLKGDSICPVVLLWRKNKLDMRQRSQSVL